jgi:hypothetical protein
LNQLFIFVDNWTQVEAEEKSGNIAERTGALSVVKRGTSEIDLTHESKKQISLLQGDKGFGAVLVREDLS